MGAAKSFTKTATPLPFDYLPTGEKSGHLFLFESNRVEVWDTKSQWDEKKQQ